MAYETLAELEDAGYTLERSVVDEYEVDGYTVPAKYVLTVSKGGVPAYEATAWTNEVAEAEALAVLSSL